jgi:hypothetical protein
MKRSRTWLIIALVGGIITFASVNGLAQFETPPFKPPITDIRTVINTQYDSLRSKFTTNKVIPSKYEKQIVFALSYFPELINSNIEFRVIESTGGIIETRPTVWSVFRHASKRTYLVLIYDSIAGRQLPSFSNADVNGQVGIVAHELSHIVYFNNSTGMGLIGLGVAHISRRYMDRFEYSTDSITIERGLGHQLLSWKQFIDAGFRSMRGGDVPETDKEPDGNNRYMTVEQIRGVMKKSNVYPK